MSSNKALVFRKVPNGLPVSGEDLVVEQAPYNSSAACPAGGIVLQSLYASIDPYQRSRMRSPDVKSYSPPFALGEPINGRGIAKVLGSESPAYKPGDLVIGFLPLQEFVVLNKDKIMMVRPLSNPLQLADIRDFLGALGIPGFTAYAGLYEIGQPRHGDTIFISAASGAVGQMVGQLAKLEGLRTIGSVGSDIKLDFITKELGFDAGFNYKTETPEQALARLAPEGLDIYYDNVGGEHLDAALEHMKDFGRVIMCGTISEYNNSESEQAYPVRAYSRIFSKRLTVRGFVCSDKGIMDRYNAEHQEKVQKWVKEGVITTRIWEMEGIDNATEAFLALFSGTNLGKVVLKY
ncbi:putative Enoyl reductase (ER) domain-containing protein [Seiridium cardinale]|uniref:Enoyl reductase (ER) domain-containing protein n=1 Tax=Seiridium cardinale TaxID=138064 RepID=A0ABR2XGT1_9PEZI